MTNCQEVSDYDSNHSPCDAPCGRVRACRGTRFIYWRTYGVSVVMMMQAFLPRARATHLPTSTANWNNVHYRLWCNQDSVLPYYAFQVGPSSGVCRACSPTGLSACDINTAIHARSVYGLGTRAVVREEERLGCSEFHNPLARPGNSTQCSIVKNKRIGRSLVKGRFSRRRRKKHTESRTTLHEHCKPVRIMEYGSCRSIPRR